MPVADPAALHTRLTHSLQAAVAWPPLASQPGSRGLTAVLQGMGRCSDWRWHGGGCAVKANGFRTLTLRLLVRVSWEEPQLSGPQGLSATAASLLPARAEAPCRAAGTLTHYVHKDECVGPLPYVHGYLNVNRI